MADSWRSVARRSETSTRTPSIAPPFEGSSRSQISRTSPSGRTIRYSTSCGSPRAAPAQASMNASRSSGCTAARPGRAAVRGTEHPGGAGPRHVPAPAAVGVEPARVGHRSGGGRDPRQRGRCVAPGEQDRERRRQHGEDRHQHLPPALAVVGVGDHDGGHGGHEEKREARRVHGRHDRRRSRPRRVRQASTRAIAATARSASSTVSTRGGQSRSAVGETAFTSTCSSSSSRRATPGASPLASSTASSSRAR